MALENTILRPLLMKKENPVPRAVSYWLFFKAHILEKPSVRKEFQITMDYQKFCLMVFKLAPPLMYGPSFCRNRKGNARRNISDLLLGIWPYQQALLDPNSPLQVRESAFGGIGLFHQGSIRIHEGDLVLRNHLWGLLWKIPDDRFSDLQQQHYPSLFQAQENFIMGGPLSLANNSCASLLYFTTAQKIKMEEFAGIPAVYVIASADIIIEPEEEILVCYSDTTHFFLDRPCGCILCVTKSQK